MLSRTEVTFSRSIKMQAGGKISVLISDLCIFKKINFKLQI